MSKQQKGAGPSAMAPEAPGWQEDCPRKALAHTIGLAAFPVSYFIGQIHKPR